MNYLASGVNMVSVNPESMRVNANINCTGAVQAASFSGNGSLLTGVTATLPSTTTADIVGNVTGAKATLSGNVSAAYFIGNGALLSGLTATLPSTLTADLLGNVTGTKATLSGNATAEYFVGNGSLLTGLVVSNSSFPKSIAADLVGNATGNVATFSGNLVSNGAVFYGNASAAYFTGNGSLLTGILVSNAWLPRTIAADLVGNVTGNAATFSGNVVGNGAVFYGNAAAAYFTGNGSLLTGILVANAWLPKTIAADLVGNVTGNAATFSGNVTGSAAVFSGNVTATSFSGSGALLTGLPRSAACFVPPSTGLSTSTTGAVTYSGPSGWRIYLQRTLDTYVTVKSYTIPNTPDSPFTGLPGNVTQTVVTPFAFAPATGLWTGNVKLTASGTFTTVSAAVGESTSFGAYAGNSNAMLASGVDLISLTGTMPSFGNASTTVYASYVNPTSGNVSLCVHFATASNVTAYGVTFLSNKTYDVKLDKNLTSLASYSLLTTGATLPSPKSARYVSETELYVMWYIQVENGPMEVYGTPLTASNVNGWPVYTAKINTVALTIPWWTCVCPLGVAGAGWTTFGGLSASPDGTRVALMGLSNVGNSTGYRFRDGTGSTASYTFAASGAVYFNESALMLDASTGLPVSGGVLSSWCSGGTPVGYTRTPYRATYTWYPDSSVFTRLCVVGETISTNWGYWSGSAWVTKLTLTDPIGGGVNVMISFPATNMASGTWGSAPISRSVSNVDTCTAVVARYAGDGNLWTVLKTAKVGTTGATTVFTFGGNAVTTPPYTTVNSGSMIVYRGKIDPSTCTFAGAVNGFQTTTADSASGYGSPHVAQAAFGQNPMTGNAHMRMVFETRIGSLTLNGVSCAGLLSGTFKVVTMDLSPNVTVTNFNTFAANSTGIVISGGESQLVSGPASDGYFTLAVTGVNNWKGGPDGT